MATSAHRPVSGRIPMEIAHKSEHMLDIAIDWRNKLQ